MSLSPFTSLYCKIFVINNLMSASRMIFHSKWHLRAPKGVLNVKVYIFISLIGIQLYLLLSFDEFSSFWSTFNKKNSLRSAVFLSALMKGQEIENILHETEAVTRKISLTTVLECYKTKSHLSRAPGICKFKKQRASGQEEWFGREMMIVLF